MKNRMDPNAIDSDKGYIKHSCPGPSKESVSWPSSETGSENSGTGCQFKPGQSHSNEKKRALEVIVGDSDPIQSYWLPKKCKPDQSLDVEDVESHAVDFQNKSRTSKAFIDADNDFQQKEHTGSSGKRRRSRWDIEPEGDGEQGEGDKTSKRRKTRWDDDCSQLKMLGPIQLPSFVKVIDGTDSDPEVQKLEMKLLQINRKLLEAKAQDERPDEKGKFRNLFEKLARDRLKVISRLIKKNPTFKLPSEYNPPKLTKKLYIPLKEYPGYNFAGLIIGPRGNMQKRMEKQTGAKIMLRGKGSSVKERKAQKKLDPSDNDDLHVLVEADNQKSLDEAVKMVETLLIPVDHGMNELKRAQLRELAELNGNLRDENLCKICGEVGHKQYACPSQSSTFLNSDTPCGACGGSSHTTANCPTSITTPCTKPGDQYHHFPADLGGGRFTFGASSASSFVLHDFGTSPSYGSHSHPGLGLTPTEDSKPNREADNAHLVVGNLPLTVDANFLMNLFSPYGRIGDAKVIKDRTTGFSGGYGFIKYDNPNGAATAAAHMKGCKIDGKILSVRVAGPLPTAGTSNAGLLASPSREVWPGPPGSMLSEPQSSPIERESLGLPPLSVFLGHTDSCNDQFPSSYRSSYYMPISSSEPPSSSTEREGLGLPPLSAFSEQTDYSNNQFRSSSRSSYYMPISSSETRSSSTGRESLGLPPLSVFLGHKDSCESQFLSSSRSSYHMPISSSEPQSSSTEREGLGLRPSSVFSGQKDFCNSQFPSSSRSSHYIPVSSPCSLTEFSGNPYYSGFSSQSYFNTPKSNFSQWFHTPQPLGRNLISTPHVPTYSPGMIPTP